ncbi:Macro domain-containing protein [Chlorella vulgaris]
MASALPRVTFRLTPTTKLVLSGPKADLTQFAGDAIVNAANERMLGGGGVDGAIHRAAGPTLLEACRKVPEVRPGVRCPTGEARITGGGDLLATHVIHTVGPVYRSPEVSAPLLESAYRSSLRLATQHGLKTIAFPAISCGVFGYALDEAAEIAVRICQQEADSLSEVHFMLFELRVLQAWLKAAEDAQLQREGDEGEARQEL